MLTRMVAWKIALSVLKHALPLRTLMGVAEPRRLGASLHADERQRIESGVRRLGRVLGGRDCLERSLVAYRFLARSGARPMLHIGFGRDDQALDGHAWVTVDGLPVAETEDAVSRYVEVLTFSPRADDRSGSRAGARGLPAGIRAAVARARRRVDRRTLRQALERVQERRYGVETSETVYYEDLGLETQDRLWHIPSDWGGLRRALARLGPGPDDVFVDIGSGLGRAVIVAAQFPFARVLGVELSAELNERASANVSRARAQRTMRCGEVELVTADATAWRVAGDVTVVYFFSPFTEKVFDRVVANLLASVDERPRPLRLLYNLPVEHGRLLRTGRVRVLDACPAKWPVADDEGEVMVTYQLLPSDGETAAALAARLPSRVPEAYRAWLGEYEPGYLIYKPKQLGGIAVYRPRRDPAEPSAASGAPGTET